MSANAIIDCHPADFHTGFELGRDHARFRVTPPAPQLTASSPVYQGFRSGQSAFGTRTRLATRHVRAWLRLRLDAWLRGCAFEAIQVTPHHLAQIDVEYCPITREPLTYQTGLPGDAWVDRMRSDAAYAAGNLAVMSTWAHRAKAGCAVDDALSFACRIEVGQLESIEGLSAPQWARLASLMSYVTKRPHEQALKLPLLVLPPNRLRLLNPIQALQALVTLQLARPGYSTRIARIEQLIPGQAVRHDFRLFFLALLPRVLQAGSGLDAQALRWALEDAWRNALVNHCWQRFARQLGATQAQTIVARTAADVDLAQRFAVLSHEQAVDGWALDTGGHVTPAGRPQRDLAAPRGRARAGAADAASAVRPVAPAPRQATLDLALH